MCFWRMSSRTPKPARRRLGKPSTALTKQGVPMKFRHLSVRFVSVMTAAALIAAGLTPTTPAHAAGQNLVMSMSADNLDPAVLNSALQDQLSTLNSNDDWRAEFS